jgi:hypothetical protein
MNWLNKGDYIRVMIYDRNLNEKAMKNLKKNSYRMLFFAFALVLTAGVIVSSHKIAYAQGGVEDTWDARLGDCAGQPTDCLDTICIGPGCPKVQN